MYGTVMIAELGGSAADAERLMAQWLTERAPHVQGFVDAGFLVGDDGRTVVNWARFTDREAYARLAADPAQDRWYRDRMAPLLRGEPTWIDGEWLVTPAPD